ncbi:MAG TPA: hypothetical protein VIT43_14655 [Candidatus Dormibacteraeota bacterium]
MTQAGHRLLDQDLGDEAAPLQRGVAQAAHRFRPEAAGKPSASGQSTSQSLSKAPASAASTAERITV